MATVIKAQATNRWRPGSFPWLARQIRLIPEMVTLPLLFSVYLLTDRALGVAVLGELIVLAFVGRTMLLWGAGRAWAQGRYGRAARWARWAVRLHPWSADGVALLAAIELARGDAEAAIAAFDRAMELFPGYAPFLVGRSHALVANQQWPEARQAASEALALDDRLPAAHAQMALIALHQHESPANAQQWIESGLLCGPMATEQALLYVARAEAALRLGQTRLAQVAVDQATMALFDCPTPAQAALLYQLGQLRRRLGEYEMARADFARIAHLDPEGRWVNAAWRASHETALHA